ncbi:MAG: orotidine 5'-phosphate decarboxylase [Candidatus Bathyarchaeota archaeon]|nr:orotidine 5'-phosphate decarboxylase [Candidatus Bathyarchaeota archaeon]
MSFKQQMEETSKNKQSSIILALDFPYQGKQERGNLLTKAKNLLDTVSPYICAVKFNHHLTLPLGIFDGVQALVEQAHKRGLLAIMDCKVNDIGNTNNVIAEYYYDAGFDAVIANPFVGLEQGIKPILDVATERHRGVILLAYMSHKGAAEGYGQTIRDAETGVETKQYLAFARKAARWNADGVVVGATVPEKIREIRFVLGEEVPIYSPGVGAQGGSVEDSVKAGARYLIVGREIVHADDPAYRAETLRQKAELAK